MIKRAELIEERKRLLLRVREIEELLTTPGPDNGNEGPNAQPTGQTSNQLDAFGNKPTY